MVYLIKSLSLSLSLSSHLSLLTPRCPQMFLWVCWQSPRWPCFAVNSTCTSTCRAASGSRTPRAPRAASAPRRASCSTARRYSVWECVGVSLEESDLYLHLFISPLNSIKSDILHNHTNPPFQADPNLHCLYCIKSP